MSTWGVQGLTVRRDGRTVLQAVDLQVSPGEIVAVVGGDGAGKTTLLRTLTRRIPPTMGAVAVPPQERIGAVIERGGVYDDLTVAENLAFAAHAYGVAPAALRQRGGELLRRAGLDAARDRLGRDLSGGMRRKLALVTALLHQPLLLVLDEATTGVDPVSRAELWRLVAHAAVEGAAVVMSTTYLDEAERAAGLLVLDGGVGLLAGTPDEVIASRPGAATLEDVVIAAQLAGAAT